MVPGGTRVLPPFPVIRNSLTIDIAADTEPIPTAAILVQSAIRGPHGPAPTGECPAPSTGTPPSPAPTGECPAPSTGTPPSPANWPSRGVAGVPLRSFHLWSPPTTRGPWSPVNWPGPRPRHRAPGSSLEPRAPAPAAAPHRPRPTVDFVPAARSPAQAISANWRATRPRKVRVTAGSPGRLPPPSARRCRTRWWEGVKDKSSQGRADAQRLVATRLLERVHDPLGHFSRLQRIHPRAR